jgi:hypothetical protein
MTRLVARTLIRLNVVSRASLATEAGALYHGGRQCAAPARPMRIANSRVYVRGCSGDDVVVVPQQPAQESLAANAANAFAECPFRQAGRRVRQGAIAQ